MSIMKKLKKLIALALVFVFALVPLTSCKEEESGSKDKDNTNNAGKNNNGGIYDSMSNYVQIEMEDGGKIVLELYPDKAPITVNNFKKLVSEGFYDGLIFHRVIKDFMIQGGDPEGTGMGGSKDKIKGEFKSNGFNNTISHKRGVISMARSQSNNSASSQFFICHADSTFLDGDYAAFGAVISGMDVVDKIANVATDSNDKPKQTQKMKSVTLIEKP